MFETPTIPTAALVERVRELGNLLTGFDGQADSAADLVVLLDELETLKGRAEGAQAMAAVALDVVVKAEQAAAGVPADRRGQGLGLQVALARRESHSRGARHLELARTLASELPHTLNALRNGQISEWRATLICRETACLSRDDRAHVDEVLDDQTLAGAGERELVAELRRLSYRLDPESVVARRRHADSQRFVSLRPAPDTMTYLTALLPVADGVATFAALTKAASAARSAGDPRSKGQVMADLLVTRVLGQDDGQSPHIPVTVNLVVSAEVLLGEQEGSAEVDGYGPIPASLARHLASASPDAAVALRRLYAAPPTGSLVAMDSTSRRFPVGLARYIRLRDRTCRTPWCDAPVRHTDHITPFGDGGATTADNGQGLCEACNYAKQAPGWTQQSVGTSPEGGHAVLTTTPTGVRYRSTAPPCPRPAALTPLEVSLDHYLHAA